jgi:alpha-galactosidase
LDQTILLTWAGWFLWRKSELIKKNLNKSCIKNKYSLMKGLYVMKKIPCLFVSLIIGGLVYSQTVKKDNFPDYESFILTPEPSPAPKINGAKVFGVRPGHPVLFSIPATGKRPITFSAKNLPKGLTLDEISGRFSGSIETPGTYNLIISAKNELGKVERAFRIVVGEKLALTPPMGWNSWNGWGDFVTAENVRATAEAMVKTGLIDHGWTNVNIDIGWEGKRGGKFNAIQPSEKFPDMKELCDYVHSLGLKIGIYSTPWVRTYFGYTGGSSDNKNGFLEDVKIDKSFGGGQYVGKYKFDKNDVKQFEEWGIDYLKFDFFTPRIDKPDSIDHIKIMSETLKNCKRDIVFSLCYSLTIDDAPKKLPYVQLWRTSLDIRDVWSNSELKTDKWAQGITDIWNSHREWREFTKPGCWADPDMLVVGWVGFGDKELHYTLLTPDEQYTHISLWCLWSAPLFIGSPIEKLDKFTLSLLSNDEVIEIDQDPLGRQAYLAKKDSEGELWVKSMEDGSKAVGLFNRSSKEITVNANWLYLGIFGKQRIRDVWRQKDLGTFEKNFGTKVPPHGVVLIRMFPA